MMKIIFFVVFVTYLNVVLTDATSSKDTAVESVELTSSGDGSSDDTSCGGDPNAQPGCGTYCTRCSNYKDKNRVCTLACNLNGCDCRPNYIYDDVSKKCVLPVDCPKTDGCFLAPEVGPCRASIPKYYYDFKKNDCVLFYYGGCGGNDNKFDSKKECLKKCS